MASPTISVTVFGGAAPVSIQVRLYKGTALMTNFSNPSSFTHTFSNLLPGNYTASIGGKNPIGGHTTMSITRDDIILHPPDDSPITRNGDSYNVNFNFTVNA